MTETRPTEIHPISRYLAKVDRSQADLARCAGVSAALISGIVNWKVVPGRAAAEAIVREAAGHLTLQEVFARPRDRRVA